MMHFLIEVSGSIVIDEKIDTEHLPLEEEAFNESIEALAQKHLDQIPAGVPVVVMIRFGTAENPEVVRLEIMR